MDFLIHWPPGPVVATVQCQGLRVKWGVSCQRWGCHYDHGLVSCDWQCRVKSQGQQVKHIDYLPLEKNDAARDGATRTHGTSVRLCHVSNGQSVQ